MSGSKPRRSSRTADFATIVADAKEKVTKAKADEFMARLEAIDTILEDAEPYDVLLACARALARAFPLCCEQHDDEFKAEFLRVLGECIAEEERDTAETESDANVPPRVH